MYIHIRVIAEAKKDLVEEVKPLHFKVWVKESRKNGLANEKLKILLGRFLRISPEKIRIISGHHSPSKLLSIPD